MSKKAGKIDAGAPPETKADKFRRLAVRRVPKAIKAISYVANLGNRNNYHYTDEQKDKVIDAIHKAYDDFLKAFATDATSNGQDSFTL